LVNHLRRVFYAARDPERAGVLSVEPLDHFS
jgi:hypothetical protein